MRYLKLYENFNDSDIHEICEKYEIENYTINPDGTIDVNYNDGGVDLYNQDINKIPLKFKNVMCSFDCANNNLTSLENSPEYVLGYFWCNYNQLTSLENCPKLIDGNFYCPNNKLTSLKFMTKCDNFNCDNNNIRDFKGFVEPNNSFSCSNNPIFQIWKLFTDTSYIELLNEYDCIRGEDIIIDRLNEFLEEIDKEPVKSIEGYNNI